MLHFTLEIAELSSGVVSNHDMGRAFEELLRKFNDVLPAGEQYTPTAAWAWCTTAQQSVHRDPANICSHRRSFRNLAALDSRGDQ